MLIDTNVCGELTRPSPDPARSGRLLENRNALALCTLDRILAPDFAPATVFGKLKANLEGQVKPVPDLDVMLCAQAIAAGMPMVTRNDGHMARTGANIINPWQN